MNRHGIVFHLPASSQEKGDTMLSRIVTETCPAPECNLTVADIEQFLPELTSYLELFAGSFVHQSQLAWSEVYLHGLLGEAVPVCQYLV
jgi:hypothetical protein